MMMGGGVAEGVTGWLLPIVLVVGAVLLATLAGGQGVLGQATGRPLLAITAGALGRRASRLTAAPVIFLMMLGWFALNASVAGTATGRLLHVPDRLGMVLFGAGMLAIVWFGVDALSWSALVAGIATVVIAIEGVATVARDRDLSLLGDGSAGAPIGALPAITLVVGYGAAFALRTPDFTRDLRSRAEVARCAVIGLCIRSSRSPSSAPCSSVPRGRGIWPTCSRGSTARRSRTCSLRSASPDPS